LSLVVVVLALEIFDKMARKKRREPKAGEIVDLIPAHWWQKTDLRQGLFLYNYEWFGTTSYQILVGARLFRCLPEEIKIKR
jgi:hypothetical protein